MLAFGIFDTAQAQSCRIGSGPDFGDGIPYCSEQPSNKDEPAQIDESPQWAPRWGAIAIDPKVSAGGIGLASDMKSRASAEATAMKLCRETGGGETCHLEIAYDNECAAIAWGDHYYKTAYAETLDEASHLALDACGRQTDHYQVFYANCSYSVRLR